MKSITHEKEIVREKRDCYKTRKTFDRYDLGFIPSADCSTECQGCMDWVICLGKRR